MDARKNGEKIALVLRQISFSVCSAYDTERSVPLPIGEGHDGMDAGGRAMQGAIAEDEEEFIGLL